MGSLCDFEFEDAVGRPAALGSVSDILTQDHVVKSLDFGSWRGTSAASGLGRGVLLNPVARPEIYDETRNAE